MKGPMALPPAAVLIFFLCLVPGCSVESGPDGAEASQAIPGPSPWVFQHQIVDPHPAATHRVTDLHLGDIDGDGRLDILTIGRGGGEDAEQMLWYHNPTWQRRAVCQGDFKYGALGDLDGDGDPDVAAGGFWFENQDPLSGEIWLRHPLGHSIVPDLVHLGDLESAARLLVAFALRITPETDFLP